MTKENAIAGPEEHIPPFLRKPDQGTRGASEFALQQLDNRIAQHSRLGLRSHPEMLAYREELALQIANGGPYTVHCQSAYF